MPADLLAALEGLLQVLSVGSDLKSLSDGPKVRKVVETLHCAKVALTAFARREPFGPSPIELTDLSRLTAEISDLNQSLKPHLIPSLRALEVLTTALRTLLDLIHAGHGSKEESLRAIEGIEKIIPHLERDYGINAQRK